MAHPNEAVVRRFLEAIPHGDMDTVDELFADGIVWHSAGRNPISGEYRGKDQVFEFNASFARMLRDGDVSHRVEVHDILANDEHTVVLWTRIAGRGNDRLEAKGLSVYHVTDGQITEVWVLHEDQYAVDEFFSS